MKVDYAEGCTLTMYVTAVQIQYLFNVSAIINDDCHIVFKRSAIFYLDNSPTDIMAQTTWMKILSDIMPPCNTKVPPEQSNRALSQYSKFYMYASDTM